MNVRAALLATSCVLLAIAVGGAHPLPPTSTDSLTNFDQVTTRRQLDLRLGPDTLEHVAQVAEDPAADFGMRLRAIRSLPLFCPSGCAGATPQVVLLRLLARDPSVTRGRDILRVRAAIEAIGVMRSGDPGDVTALVPYLDDASRDIRAATASALANLCNTSALPAVRNRYMSEQVDQVRIALSDALRVLASCTRA